MVPEDRGGDGGTRREHGNAITVHSFFELEPRVVLPEKKVNSGSEPFAASGTSEALGVVNSEASAPDETAGSIRPRRKRADCQFYDQPDKNDDGLLCIGDRFKIANEVSFCAEPYSPGSWYLAAKKGIDLGQGRRLGADPATFDYHPTNGY